MSLFDLPQTQNNKDKMSSIKFRLWLALLWDVKIDNFPEAVGTIISTNPLLPGKTWKYIDCKVNSIDPNAAPGESPIMGILTLPAILEGLNPQTLSWIYKNKGLPVIALWERCEDRQFFLGGSPCSGGLTIGYTNIGKLDGGNQGVALNLTGGECSEPIYFYNGPIIREEPQAVSLSSGTTFGINAKSQYVMQDNAAAKTLSDITNVTNNDVGRIIEIQGAGVVFPTLIDNSAKFILRNGLPFSAKNGSSISFQITKSGSGFVFYEVYRS